MNRNTLTSAAQLQYIQFCLEVKQRVDTRDFSKSHEVYRRNEFKIFKNSMAMWWADAFLTLERIQLGLSDLPAS